MAKQTARQRKATIERKTQVKVPVGHMKSKAGKFTMTDLAKAYKRHRMGQDE